MIKRKPIKKRNKKEIKAVRWTTIEQYLESSFEDSDSDDDEEFKKITYVRRVPDYQEVCHQEEKYKHEYSSCWWYRTS